MQTKEKTTNKLDFVLLNDPNLVWKNTNKTPFKQILPIQVSFENAPCYHLQFLK